MSQEPQKPRWPEAEIKTIPKRLPNESGSGEAARDADSSSKRGSFGERLQRERELRAISLDEIAKSTKIGTRLLQALEAEEFDKLPGGIFNKGFVRAYAKYLGLDEEQAVTDYIAAENEKERARRSPSSAEERNISNPKLFAIEGGARPDNVYNIRASAEVAGQDPPQGNGFLMAAVILVFVLGIGGFGWKYYRTHSDAKAATPVSEKPAQSTPTVQTPQPSPIQTQPTSTVATDSVTPASTNPAQVSDATTTPAKSSTDPSAAAAKRLDSVTPKPNDASSDAKLTAPTEAVQSGAFTLDLRADEQSWVQISSEGKVLWSGMVNKDATKSFHATKEMIVKLGNAPAVELSYNGKPLPRFSQDSRTRTLTFTSQGLSPQ